MNMVGGSEYTIIIGPSKSVLIYALHSLEYVLGLARADMQQIDVIIKRHQWGWIGHTLSKELSE